MLRTLRIFIYVELSFEHLVISVHAIITSRSDFCNSLFYGSPDKELRSTR